MTTSTKRMALLACLVWIAGTTLCWWLAQVLQPVGGQGLAGYYVHRQDGFLLLMGALVAALGLMSALAFRITHGVGLGPRTAMLLALLAVVVAVAGRRWLLMGYDLSRDEQMAGFDAWIYAHGVLAWPLPPGWQADTPMLNTLFMLPVGHPVAWVSAYLPGHAAIRALVGMVAPGWLGGQGFTGPLMLGASVWLLHGIARRMLEPGGAAVAMAMLLLSGQALFGGMSAFAMPAHLAINLLWLRLFLEGRRRTDAAAIVTGVVGTGLHQPLFHPLFVAPWLALLLARRQWRRLATFVLAYGAIGIFWLAWPRVTHDAVWGPGSFVSDVGGDYLSRLIDMLHQNDNNLPIMAANLLRFATWNHVALIPLALVGAFAARRDGRAAAALAGLVLPVVVMGLILPYQGYGFGYRYLHGLLGNVALLAGFGWQRLAPWHPRLRPMLIATSLGTLAMMAAQGTMTHRLYATFADRSAAITASGADYLIMGGNDGAFALDLILNRPDLANHPLRLSIWEIDDADALAARLCAGGGKRLALPLDSFFAAEDALFARKTSGEANARFAETKTAFEQAGCGVSVLK
jgi:hypothetical protein